MRTIAVSRYEAPCAFSDNWITYETYVYSYDMAGYNFKDEKEVQEYLKNLHIEYQFGCLSEKKPEGKVSLLMILTSCL